MIRVSVVVPTYRRPELLARCLTALLAQEFEPSAYEIIVADDAASAATRRQVRAVAAASCVALQYVPVGGVHGPAAARNAGWRAARGAVVAFTDDDCLPDPGWLTQGLAVFDRDAQVQAAAGRVLVPLPPQPTDYELDTAGLEIAEFVTANCFVRRQALRDVNGFDERFTTAWREDSDLQFTLLEKGARVVDVADAIVVHPVRPAPWGISLQQQVKSCFDALLYKKHPVLFRKRIRPVTPWDYYGIAVALIAMPIAASFAAWSVVFPLLLLWIVLTGRFCSRRLAGTAHSGRHIAEIVITSLLIPIVAIYWRLYGAAKYRVLFL